jgi:hypothetical protein
MPLHLLGASAVAAVVGATQTASTVVMGTMPTSKHHKMILPKTVLSALMSIQETTPVLFEVRVFDLSKKRVMVPFSSILNYHRVLDHQRVLSMAL